MTKDKPLVLPVNNSLRSGWQPVSDRSIIAPMSKNPASKPKPGVDADVEPICTNRKARYKYDILDDIECGIVLQGSEVKSLRDGKGSLDEAYARVRDCELWLIGCDIAVYPQANLMNHEPKRTRKLLLHRRELRKFADTADHKGLTLVPLAMYFKRGIAKVQVAIGKGRKLHDKREQVKKTEVQKDIRRAMIARR